jgi:hypothetical protein
MPETYYIVLKGPRFCAACQLCYAPHNNHVHGRAALLRSRPEKVV